MDGNERLTMTITEFAKATGCNRNLIYDLARQDKLPVPVIRLGKRMVLIRKAVEALLEAGKQLGPEVRHERQNT